MERNDLSNVWVSIVMPAYNAAATIGQSIDSVLAQTFSDWELLVIDDCSGDGTADIVKEYSARDGRVILFQNVGNQGVSAARNQGVARARGDWIAFLDSDDLWTPDKLDRQVRLIRERKDAGRKPDLIFTGSAFISGSGKKLGYRLEVPEEITYRELLKQNLISCSSVLVRRELMLRYPMKRDDMHEDYAVWLQILKNGGRAYGINQPLLIYRMSETSKSGNKKKAAFMTYKVYRFMGLNLVQSIYYFCWYAYRNLKKYYAITHKEPGRTIG